MTTLLFDLETDGLLDEVTKIHCAWIIDCDTEESWGFRPGQDAELLAKLDEADVLVGHNISKGCGYDLPVLKKLHGWEPRPEVVIHDTLVMAELLWPDIAKRDFGRKRSGFPANLIGRHSLEAYGYRLNCEKDSFGKTADWLEFSEEMYDYCLQDCTVNLKLYDRIKAKGWSQDAVELEYATRVILQEQQANGWRFDMEAAARLYGELAQRRDECGDKLRGMFGGWYKAKGQMIPKRTVHYKSKPWTVRGAPYTKIEWTEFNPGSRDHLIKVLLEKGWKPKDYTQNGKPQVNEGALKGLKFDGAWEMYLYLSYVKILGQLAEGKQAWMNAVKTDGRIYHRCKSIGTVTSRGAHSGPNLGQVPNAAKVIDGFEVGKECRKLFTANKDWVMVGADQSGLELRMLAHYMAKWDGGDYTNVLLNGDIHTANQEAAGLPTRDNAKVFIYGFLYGAGDEKIGSIVNGSSRKGRELRNKFLTSLPALNNLINAVKGAAKKRGGVKTLDGRFVPVSSEHAALNYLLQSAGAIVCKRWMVIFHQLMKDEGLEHGKDWQQHGWIHDEIQCSCPEEHTGALIECFSRAGVMAGEYYNLSCPTESDAMIGTNWKDTH